MKEIVEPLLNWYFKNKRMLLWRYDKDPYHVWISEIMLQQTRIETVKEYYKKFMKKVPSISDLAMIEEDELLKLWEGLGYYNRARNLRLAAIQIMEKYDGKFPTEYEEIIKLPGIGEYTAGAISSICFSKKEVAIDGNVLRVYMRLKNSRQNIDEMSVRKEVSINLKKILPKQSGDFNEAMMELGELICLPNGMPKCSDCPLKSFCQSYRQGTMLELPVRNGKKKIQEEKYTVYLYICKNKIAIEKREAGLLQKLWQFPNDIGYRSLKKVKESMTEKSLVVKKIKKNIESKHVFSHRIWKMQSYLIELDDEIPEYQWVTVKEIKEKYAIAVAFQPFVKEITNIIEKNML